MSKIKAILLMGGSGRRFGNEIPKQFHLLGNRKVYEHTLAVFQESGLFAEIVCVTHRDWIEEVRRHGITVVSGGETRQSSSLQGLLACGSGTDIVVIHDAVRPFVSLDILQRNIEGALRYGAVDTCIPSADTIVHSKSGEKIDAIPLRREYWLGQTPQSFSYPLIIQAHEQTKKADASDDCQLVLDIGHPVHIVRGEESNIKITTEGDLERAEALLSLYRRKNL